MSCSSGQLKELFPESTFVENVKVRGTIRRSIIMSMSDMLLFSKVIAILFGRKKFLKVIEI